MKTSSCILIFILWGLALDTHSAEKVAERKHEVRCESESNIYWGKNNDCGAQIFANGGVPLDYLMIVNDNVYPGSDARFKCTKEGWKFLSGHCTADTPDTKSNPKVKAEHEQKSK